jgi:hypothetical protein
METQIRQNLTVLCKKTFVDKPFMDELYSKDVITEEFKQQLVRKHFFTNSNHLKGKKML